ncbi:MAG: hypothetical protein QM582_09570 [Micropruina sp.]|uniref:hypothetical protein n=1 Tax=Micropruina sp. TaxID=2737536 RepID=UPI0039E44E50
MRATKGQAQGVAAAGLIQVRREGKTDLDWASVDRQIGSVAVAGDWLLLLEQDRQLWAVALLGTAPGPIIAPPAPEEDSPETAQIVTGTDTIPPTWSGTWRDGKWRGDTSHMIQGPSSWGMSRGAAFYGKKLKSLPGSITSMKVRCERLTYGSYSQQRPTMALLAGTSKPSGWPTVRDTASGPLLGGPGSVESWTVPTSWLDDFNSGAAGGIGIVGTSNYMRLDGPGLRVTAKWRDQR